MSIRPRRGAGDLSRRSRPPPRQIKPPMDSAAAAAEARIAAGRAAEARALHFLRWRGLSLVVKNYACTGGEIDLIMDDGGVFVFVEVRSRRPGAQVGALESIDGGKRRRLQIAARHFLAHKKDPSCRFDAVCIDGARLEWIRDLEDF